MKDRRKTKAFTVAFCGMMAALGAVIMLVGSFLGVLTFAAPLAAMLCLVPVLYELGKGYTLLAYAVTALVTALLAPDKELAFFYVFTGFYPVLRVLINRLPSRPLRIIIKLAFFSAAIALMYVTLIFLLGSEAILNELGESGTLLFILSDAALVVIALLFDPVLAASDILYEKRLRPRLGFLKGEGKAK